MTVFEFMVAFYVAGGLVALSAWSVRIYVTSTLPPHADRTTKLVYYGGRALIWAGALVVAGGVFGVAARAAWRLAS